MLSRDLAVQVGSEKSVDMYVQMSKTTDHRPRYEGSGDASI